MTLPKRYDPASAEPRMAARWGEIGVYHFEPGREPVYAIDTPPPTVSGHLHLGSVYSYSHADFIARFHRMRGQNVFYPMGYDDNGLPTERLVERVTGKTAEDMGRGPFIERCLELAPQFEQEYEELWQRLGLSVDWRYTYRTIDALSRTTSQRAFLHLLKNDLVYRQQAPTIWCPHCHTAIAQAEEADLQRTAEFVTLPFTTSNGEVIPIATTRPELLPACVALFVHPGDERYRRFVGGTATVPLFGHEVPVLADEHADPEKGTGAVMCCTFGDTVDVEWWRTHNLPLREGFDRHGRLTSIAGPFASLSVPEGKRAVVEALEERGLLLGRQPVEQSVRVHERCDTPVEYVVTQQWFVRVLDHKESFLRAGDAVIWHPQSMHVRYREWVENLHWDWCISRQRYYGVPFPVWYCSCGRIIAATEEMLPVDPTAGPPPRRCECGSEEYTPEKDVMDTWATSSLTPQIGGHMLSDRALYDAVFPMSLRAQAHEIIRTWAFYTIVQSMYGESSIPWREILVSGWGLAPEGAAKISKSRGGGPMAPMEMIGRYGADAVRYWAAGTGPGKDSVISEEKIGAGAKLVTKLWNVAAFGSRFLEGYSPPSRPPSLTPADRWLLSRLQRAIADATGAFEAYEYAAARTEIEGFFWRDLSDNYLEIVKKRLYDENHSRHEGGKYTLYRALLTVVKLFAPFLPYVTDEIYTCLFAAGDGDDSVHRSPWPLVEEALVDERAEAAGESLIAIATTVRRYKSDAGMSLGAPLQRLSIEIRNSTLTGAEDDIASVTRAENVTIDATRADGLEELPLESRLGLRIRLAR